MKTIDIEEIANKTNKILNHDFPKPTEEHHIKFKPFIENILNGNIKPKDFPKYKKKYGFTEKHSFLFRTYLDLVEKGELDTANEDTLRACLRIKACKSWSGIMSITIFTAPHPEYTNEHGERVKQSFSCAFNCSYCPNEPGQPRSYLKMEPGVLRANRNNFLCAEQMWDRMLALYMTGHLNKFNKLEIIVSGGTWTSYPREYREEFCRDIFYAANTFWQKEPRRPRLSLTEEKTLNRQADSRVVGLTIETRPDTINPEEIRLLRYYGCTRVQLGIQHIDDDVLDKINRKCPTAKTIKAIEMLKRNCFKIDAHWMPNLPNTTPAKDRNMLVDVLCGVRGRVIRSSNKNNEEWEFYNLSNPEFSVDQWKVYPTAITPYTDIEKWYKEGTYKQYDEATLIDILLQMKTLIFPWIRLNRVIRDIPTDYIYNENTGSDNTSMRQELMDIMRHEGKYCYCIRCREVKDKTWDGKYITSIRRYNASNGDEYFISAESQDNKTLYGFVRLRLDDATNKAFEELNGAALIRELHVYGQYAQFGDSGVVQHKGLGKYLMGLAERIASDNHYKKIAVIASEGTVCYYQKLGYNLEGSFVTKSLFSKIK